MKLIRRLLLSFQRPTKRLPTALLRGHLKAVVPDEEDPTAMVWVLSVTNWVQIVVMVHQIAPFQRAGCPVENVARWSGLKRQSWLNPIQLVTGFARAMKFFPKCSRRLTRRINRSASKFIFFRTARWESVFARCWFARASTA